MHLPQALDSTLEARQLGYGGRQYRTRRRTPWSSWGRWVLAGILIVLGILLLFFALCIRRRRMKRARSYATTGAPMTANNHTSGPGYNAPPTGGYGGNNTGYAPPPGAPPQYGHHGGSNDGYYGQTGGVTQPQGAYVK